MRSTLVSGHSLVPLLESFHLGKFGGVLHPLDHLDRSTNDSTLGEEIMRNAKKKRKKGVSLLPPNY